MANTQVSYKGQKVYYNNDSTTSPFLIANPDGELYLNSDMSNMFNSCTNLVMNLDAIGLNHQYVTNMSNTYNRCFNLTGTPVCGPNVTNMSGAYTSCRNITGSPVCGLNVTDMSYAYCDCEKLTGPPICGPNVTDMSNAYRY